MRREVSVQKQARILTYTTDPGRRKFLDCFRPRILSGHWWKSRRMVDQSSLLLYCSMSEASRAFWQMTCERSIQELCILFFVIERLLLSQW